MPTERKSRKQERGSIISFILIGLLVAMAVAIVVRS